MTRTIPFRARAAGMDAALTRIDRYLADDGNGPVVYARLSDLARVWPAPSR